MRRMRRTPEGATGAGTGAVLGGALGWLVGIGALAIPGLGPFIAAGPIMAALAGAGVGGTVGGLTGALIGMGTPEYEAKWCIPTTRNGLGKRKKSCRTPGWGHLVGRRKALHDEIGALESRVVMIGPRRSANLRKRIEESRRQEAAILAKLSKAGVSLDI